MENNNNDYSYQNVVQLDDSETASRRYLASVFLWMFVALGVSAFVAFEFYLNTGLMQLIATPLPDGGLALTGLGYVALFSPLAFSLVISFGFNRIGYTTMVVLFMAYAVAIGITLSILGLIYTSGSIFSVFLSAALVFAVMSIAGYKTKTDLTSFGSILYTIFIGAFIVGLVNFFFHSEQLQYIISFVFVIVLVGLTAYYIQMLKRIGAGIEYGAAESKKLVIIGAFVLYTTFINLFMSMLRIFGSRR